MTIDFDNRHLSHNCDFISCSWTFCRIIQFYISILRLKSCNYKKWDQITNNKDVITRNIHNYEKGSRNSDKWSQLQEIKITITRNKNQFNSHKCEI